MKTLVILNDPAYGTERSYNGLRLAHSLAKRNGEKVRIFLLADAVTCRRSNLEELTDWTLWADKVVAFQGDGPLASCRLASCRERTADA